MLWPEYPVALPPAQPDPGASEERLRAFVAEVAGDLPFACEVSQGLVGIEILDRARDLSPELLVVGTSGRGALERPGAGSVAEHLIRHGTVPVLAVPEAAGATEVEDFHTLVVAIDFSLDAQAAVRFACRLLRGDGGEVVLTHVLEQFGGCFASTHYEVPEFQRALEHEARRRLQQFAPPGWPTVGSVRSVVTSGHAGREILQVAAAYETNLIVLGARGRNALDLAVFGSTTRYVLHRSPVPVLSVPLTARHSAGAREISPALRVLSQRLNTACTDVE